MVVMNNHGQHIFSDCAVSVGHIEVDVGYYEDLLDTLKGGYAEGHGVNVNQNSRSQIHGFADIMKNKNWGLDLL